MVSTLAGARVSAKRLAAVVAVFVGLATCHAPLHAAPSRAFGWKATKNGRSVFLVGSVHLLTKDFYPLHPAFEQAFAASDLLVEEVDYAEAMGSQLEILARAVLPPGQSLDTVLSAPTLALVNKRLQQPGLPLPAAVLKQLKPWMLAITLLESEWAKAGFDADLGLDKHFYDRAKKTGKQVQGLETAAYQISRLDELPMPLQDKFLASTLSDIDKELGSISSLVTAWRNGEVDTLEKLTLEDMLEEPVIYERLLLERNRNWMPKIEALFTRPTPTLIIVGAAHLIGPDGLLKMLQARGYTIEQMQ
jgi:uncharacterized protein YbaP (TraB family)